MVSAAVSQILLIRPSVYGSEDSVLLRWQYSLDCFSYFRFLELGISSYVSAKKHTDFDRDCTKYVTQSWKQRTKLEDVYFIISAVLIVLTVKNVHARIYANDQQAHEKMLIIIIHYEEMQIKAK